MTFTKRWVRNLLIMGCLWISASYILAYCGRDQIAESLSTTVATVIIATILGYLCKSFFETKEEQKNLLKREEMNNENSIGKTDEP